MIGNRNIARRKDPLRRLAITGDLHGAGGLSDAGNAGRFGEIRRTSSSAGVVAARVTDLTKAVGTGVETAIVLGVATFVFPSAILAGSTLLAHLTLRT